MLKQYDGVVAEGKMGSSRNGGIIILSPPKNRPCLLAQTMYISIFDVLPEAGRTAKGAGRRRCRQPRQARKGAAVTVRAGCPAPGRRKRDHTFAPSLFTAGRFAQTVRGAQPRRRLKSTAGPEIYRRCQDGTRRTAYSGRHASNGTQQAARVGRSPAVGRAENFQAPARPLPKRQGRKFFQPRQAPVPLQ